MKLYGYWRSAATLRVRIALNLKDIQFEEEMYDLLQGDQFKDSYKALNPQSVVPALALGRWNRSLSIARHARISRRALSAAGAPADRPPCARACTRHCADRGG